jgi:hypothetical protein
MNSNLIPLIIFGPALVAALVSGCVIDCRGGPRLILRRSESPVYYWFIVSVLAAITALWLVIDSN